MFPKRRILALEQDSGKGKAACCRQESAVLARLRREINGGNIPFPLFLGPQKQPRFHSKPEPPGVNALITARRKFRFWIEIIQKNGGERGIRTLGGSFDPHSLSRRAPSASSAISPRPTLAVRGACALRRKGYGFSHDQWRRERDSNPRDQNGQAVFKTASFNHSDIPPATKKNITSCTRGVKIFSF